MNEHRGPSSQKGEGLPAWLTATVVCTVLALLIYTIVKFGPEGYPLSMMLGSIIGVYAGADQLLKRRGGDDK